MQHEQMGYEVELNASLRGFFRQSGQEYTDPTLPIIQIMQNSVDGAMFSDVALEIVLVLYKGDKQHNNRVVVFDNATGITNRVLTLEKDGVRDRTKLDEFWSGFHAGRIHPGGDPDILSLVPLRALICFYTMARHINESWKSFTKQGVQHGKKGHGGTTGWEGMGQDGAEGMFLVSRPRPTVKVLGQEQNFGNQYQKAGEREIPVWSYILPPDRDLLAGKNKGSIVPSKETVIGSWLTLCPKAPLDPKTFYYGTRAEIYGVPNDYFSSFKIPQLLNRLQLHFGNVIRNRGIKITVVDCLTKESQKIGGTLHRVKAREYLGRPVVNGEYVTASGLQLVLDIRYDVYKKQPGIEVLEGDMYICQLHQISDVDHDMWRRPQLTGTIRILGNVPDLLIPSKQGIRGKHATSFINFILNLRKRVEQEVASIESGIRSSQLVEVGQVTNLTLQTALQSNPTLSLYLRGISGSEKPRETRTTTTGYKSATNEVRIEIVDQNGQGVPDLPAVLWKVEDNKPQRVKDHITTHHGSATFGSNLSFGEYIMQIGIPEGTTLLYGDKTRVDFVLKELQRGWRKTFHLNLRNPRPKPTKRSIGDVTLVYDPNEFEEEPELPWKGDIGNGKVFINTLHGTFTKARKTSDESMNHLVATFVAFAAVAYIMEGEPTELVLAYASTFAPEYAQIVLDAIKILHRRKERISSR